MRTLNNLLLICAAALACGCAHTGSKMDWITVGPRFPAKSPEQVEVLRDYSEMKHPAGAIGEMKGENIDKDDPDQLGRQVREARRLSAENGADAVVVKKKQLMFESSPLDGSDPQPPQYYIHARALKYVNNLTPEEKAIIKRWRPETLDDLNIPVQGNLPGVDWNSGRR
ncbi:MAG TPA: hypothetical protein PLL10_01780 [Elusimicrobiales bacterium]|nr:hypothetical protein [Elusimicrobiales bacterium]